MQSSPTGFNIGSVFSRTFSVLFGKPGLFIALAFISMLPSLLLEVFLPQAGTWANVLDALFGLIIQGAIVYAVYRVLTEKVVTVGDSVSVGFSRFLPLLGVAILTWLGIVVGLVFLIIPGLILMAMWAVTIPACVVEGKGVTESISRSMELTKGFRLQIFALFLIAYLAYFALSFIIGAMIGFGIGLAGGFGSEGFSNLGYLVLTIFSTVLLVLPQAFLCVMPAVVYYDLRSDKEGVSVEKLSHIFE